MSQRGVAAAGDASEGIETATRLKASPGIDKKTLKLASRPLSMPFDGIPRRWGKTCSKGIHCVSWDSTGSQQTATGDAQGMETRQLALGPSGLSASPLASRV